MICNIDKDYKQQVKTKNVLIKSIDFRQEVLNTEMIQIVNSLLTVI